MSGCLRWGQKYTLTVSGRDISKRNDYMKGSGFCRVRRNFDVTSLNDGPMVPTPHTPLVSTDPKEV